MPLPAPNSPWPPPRWDHIYASYRTWDAWYSGDVDRLAAVYGAQGGYGPDLKGYNKPSQFSDGMVGRLSRWFWGTPQRQVRSSKLHIPAAADIAATSADLLLSEPPTLTVDDESTQQRLDELFDESTVAALVEGVEVAAALGGVFLRVGWDRDAVDRPILSVVHPDAALPTFRWGQLAEVTFHRELARSEGKVWRHMEHHVPGGVQHALYVGEADSLGRPIPLTEHPETAPLAEAVSDDAITIETGLDGLDVEYLPNITPNREWRADPIGSHLGRSDFAGIEPILDALDEAYTSWMRDVRLAKGRLIVPQHYLETEGRGSGATMDLDREVFTPVNKPPDGSGSSEITVSQFAIRHEEHSATCSELWEKAVRGAGYSAQTFGLTSEVAMTATESNAREKKTHLTRGKKVRLCRMALSKIAETMLALDRTQFGSSVQPRRPDVQFAPITSEQPSERADTARILTEAEAVSTETKVRMVHPDWDDERVQAEVAGIMSERAPAPEMSA